MSRSRVIQFNATPQQVNQLSAHARIDQPSADRSLGQMYAQSTPVEIPPPPLARHGESLSVHDLDEYDDEVARRGDD